MTKRNISPPAEQDIVHEAKRAKAGQHKLEDWPKSPPISENDDNIDELSNQIVHGFIHTIFGSERNHAATMLLNDTLYSTVNELKVIEREINKVPGGRAFGERLKELRNGIKTSPQDAVKTEGKARAHFTVSPMGDKVSFTPSIDPLVLRFDVVTL